MSLLQQGHLVGLSPGGTYEAQMGDNMYKLMWRARDGFARVVSEAGEVPVIPVFTQVRNFPEEQIILLHFQDCDLYFISLKYHFYLTELA